MLVLRFKIESLMYDSQNRNLNIKNYMRFENQYMIFHCIQQFPINFNLSFLIKAVIYYGVMFQGSSACTISDPK